MKGQRLGKRIGATTGRGAVAKEKEKEKEEEEEEEERSTIRMKRLGGRMDMKSKKV